MTSEDTRNESTGSVSGRAQLVIEERVEESPIVSPLQPTLDHFIKTIRQNVGSDSIEESYISNFGSDMPYLVISVDYWLEVAALLKEEPSLDFNYMRSLSAVDYETHMEMVYYFYSFTYRHQLGIRVKLDRENPMVSTISHLWKAADWSERECFDLFGIHFAGHANLKRILMPDDWIGHPLRKDYEPADQGV